MSVYRQHKKGWCRNKAVANKLKIITIDLQKHFSPDVRVVKKKVTQSFWSASCDGQEGKKQEQTLKIISQIHCRLHGWSTVYGDAEVQTREQRWWTRLICDTLKETNAEMTRERLTRKKAEQHSKQFV